MWSKQLNHYPSRILPNKKFKFYNCHLNDKFIIRAIKETAEMPYVPADESGLYDENNKIKEEYLCYPKQRLASLSVSLYGTFNDIHSWIELTEAGKEKYNHECCPDTQVSTPTKEHYIVKQRFSWYMAFNDIHMKRITINSKDKTYQLRCHVKHKPAKWNFWHYSFEWEIEGVGWLHEIEDKKIKNNIADKIGRQSKDVLKFHAKIAPEKVTKIKRQCYYKNVGMIENFLDWWDEFISNIKRSVNPTSSSLPF